MKINEVQISNWFKTHPNEGPKIFVQLVKKLVRTSSSAPEHIRFPEDTGTTGADGELIDQNGFQQFIPKGRSIWEISIKQKYKTKANDDYDRYLDGKIISLKDMKKSTFIYLTPHRWDNVQEWITEKKATNIWKDIKVIDRSMLSDWMELFFNISIWFLTIAKGVPLGVNTPENHWNVLSSYGSPDFLLPSSIFLTDNRSEAIEKLEGVLKGDTYKYCFKMLHSRYLTDFISAFLASTKEYDTIKNKCLIISDAKSWELIIDSVASGHIFIASNELDMCEEGRMDLIQKTRNKGHRCLFWGTSIHSISTELINPTKYDLINGLVSVGCSRIRAEDLVKQSASDLFYLLRKIQGVPGTPEWARNNESSKLAISNLLGKWDEFNKDERKAIETLVDGEYKRWIQSIRIVNNSSSSPLTIQDGEWSFIQRYDGWFSLGKYIYDEHLDRFSTIAIEILTEINPKLHYSDERTFFGSERKFSKRIRLGIAETLCLLSSFPNQLPNVTFGNPIYIVRKIVHSLFEIHNWESLASLDDILPFIAEAAPEMTISYLETMIESFPDIFTRLFGKKTNLFFSSPNFMGIMWGLQVLAWNPDFFPQVISILGKLASLDPGGNHNPRPFSTLISLLVPWLHQTCASINLRLSAIKELFKEQPETAWKLILRILNHSSSSSYHSRPVWAKWIPSDFQDRTNKEDYNHLIDEYKKIALKNAVGRSDRLQDLILNLNKFLDGDIEKIINSIISLAQSSINSTNIFNLWKTIQHVIIENKIYAKSWGDSALNPSQISKLEQVSLKLVPEQVSEIEDYISIWNLFNENNLDPFEDRGDPNEFYSNLNQRRKNAVFSIYKEQGIEKILHFAHLVRLKYDFGNAVGKIKGIAIPQVIRKLLKENLKEFTRSFINSYFWENGKWEWYDQLKTSDWNQDESLNFLLILPCTREAWSRAKKLLGDEEAEYWEKIRGNPRAPEKSDDLVYLIEKYLSVGRNYPAIWILSHREYQNLEPSQFPSELAYRALMALPQQTTEVNEINLDLHSLSYSIMQLMKILQEQSNLSIIKLQNLELAYLPVFSKHSGYGNIKPINLEQRLVSEPVFFCEIVRYLSGPTQVDEDFEETEEIIFNENKFHRFYKLFDNWSLLPGIVDGNVQIDILLDWIENVRSESERIGYSKSTLEYLGKILARYPPDPSGLWINLEIAKILDQHKETEMRNSFSRELFNSSGARVTDGSGEVERRIGDGYNEKAKRLNTEGYHRLAQTIRDLANNYYDMANRKAKHRNP